MIQFLLSISLVSFFILEITLLRMLFAQQGEKMLNEIVKSCDRNLNHSELDAHKNPVLVPNKVTIRSKKDH